MAEVKGVRESDAREIAHKIATAGDYWKDYSSIRCALKIDSGKICGQRLRAASIDVGLLTERITAALLANPDSGGR